MKHHLEIKLGIIIALLILVLWVGVTSTVFRCMHPKATQTEISLHIWRYVMLDFTYEEE